MSHVPPSRRVDPPRPESGRAASKVYPDTLSQSAALALAKRLQNYWHERGYPAARFWTEPLGERFAKVGTYDLYRIVCNLVNGLPPKYRS